MKIRLSAIKESKNLKILGFDPSASFRAGSMENRKFFGKHLIIFSTGSKNIKQGGYIALTSVIIISLLLITIITALSSVNYFSRYNILENEFKERSGGLAEACVDYAFAKIAANSSYDPSASGGECVTVGTDKCKVVSVSGNVIATQGVFQKSYTNLNVAYNPSTLAVTSWQELPQKITGLCP